MVYPSGLTLAYGYSALSELKTVSNPSAGTYWTLQAKDAERKIAGGQTGNGAVETRGYFAATGRLGMTCH